MDYTTLIRKRIKEKFKTIESFAKYIGIPRTTINSILKKGVGSSSYDLINRIFEVLDIYPFRDCPITLNSRSIRLLNDFEKLDDMGKHAVESMVETECRRINGSSSTNALIAAYGGLSDSTSLTDEEKVILNLIQKSKENYSKHE
ncbi:MAG: helix-turn-helix transcriptional regulator [Clostridia bacterium]|nr:helix-turn-helix transcriptional regulator [Clostridia bacterium]